MTLTLSRPRAPRGTVLFLFLIAAAAAVAVAALTVAALRTTDGPTVERSPARTSAAESSGGLNPAAAAAVHGPVSLVVESSGGLNPAAEAAING